MSKLKPCPFCGGIELDIQRGTPEGEGVPTNVICTECGACGPWEYCEKDEYTKAKKAWDNRL